MIPFNFKTGKTGHAAFNSPVSKAPGQFRIISAQAYIP
jgi:hypothetical protein